MSDRILPGSGCCSALAGCSSPGRSTANTAMNPWGPPLPMGIVGLMLLCSVAMLLRHPDTVEWPPKRILQRLLVMVIVLLMYAGL